MKNLRAKNWVKDRPEGATCFDWAAITPLPGYCGGKVMPKRRSRGSRWPPSSCKDFFFWYRGYRVYLEVGNHFQTRWHNYGTIVVHFWFLVSWIWGFHYLGHVDLVDRSFDIMCLHFWIRSYSDCKCMDLPSWEFHNWISWSWHILDASSFHELLHLKFKRALYQLIFPSTIFASPFCNLPWFSPTVGEDTGNGIVVREIVRESGNSHDR